MSTTHTEVIGADEIGRDLARVGDELDDLGGPATAAGQAVKQKAQSAAPVDTGALSRSIRADIVGSEVTVGAYAPYAGYQEFGTATVPASPYLRPALEAAQNQIVDAYTGEIQDKLGTVKGA